MLMPFRATKSNNYCSHKIWKSINYIEGKNKRSHESMYLNIQKMKQRIFRAKNSKRRSKGKFDILFVTLGK